MLRSLRPDAGSPLNPAKQDSFLIHRDLDLDALWS
jgi:hypothetical protein